MVSIKKSPNAANPTLKTIEVLSKLAKDQNNTVLVISGRDKESISSWLGNIPGIGLSAEHGNFVKFPHSFHWADSSSTLVSLDWKCTLLDILTYFTERTPGSFIEHKQRSICWHYRLADPEFGSRQAKECQLNLEASLLSKYQVEILLGKKVIEVRSSFCNKGIDDRTDEDMFRVLESGVPVFSQDSVKLVICVVGSSLQKSVAKYRTESPESLLDILIQLS